MAAPANPTLASVASAYDALGFCADFCDAEWFHVFSTRENDRMAADPLAPASPPNHWFGPEVTAWIAQPYGTSHSRRDDFLRMGPWLLHDTPGGRDGLRRRVDPTFADLVDELEPAPLVTAMTWSSLDGTGHEFSYGGQRSGGSSVLATRARDDASGQYGGSVADDRAVSRHDTGVLGGCAG